MKQNRWYRPRNIAIGAALLSALWLGRQVQLALTAKPGLPMDIAKAATELMERYQPEGSGADAGAWADLLRAIKVLHDAETEIERRSGDLHGEPLFDYSGLGDPAAMEYLTPEQQARVSQRTRAILREFSAAGGGVALADLARAERVIGPVINGPFLNDLDRLSDIRRLARVCRARMALAREDEDGRGLAAAYEQGFALGRVCRQQATVLDQLNAVPELLNWELRRVLSSPAPFLRGHHLRLLDAHQRQLSLFPPTSFAVETWWLDRTNTLQHLYTDDGRGNGRLIISAALMLGQLSPRSDGWTGWVLERLGDYQIVNVLSAGYPSKRAARARIDEYFGRMLELSRSPRHSRLDAMQQFEAWGDAIPPRHILLYQDKAGNPWMRHTTPLDHADALDAQLAGTTLLIALHLHQSRTGAWPQSLDELMPVTLAELPPDPYTGDQFRCRAEPDGPSAPAFVLYSVGFDGVDDGGKQHPEGFDSLYAGNPTGYDFVVNIQSPLLSQP